MIWESFPHVSILGIVIMIWESFPHNSTYRTLWGKDPGLGSIGLRAQGCLRFMVFRATGCLGCMV